MFLHGAEILLTFLCGSVLGQSCPEGEPITHFDANDESDPSVFDDLTAMEIRKVYDYLLARNELNVKDATMLTLDSTYVYNIERFTPPKAEVLAYLEGTGPKPGRFAWVILHRGDLSPPVVEEYKVGPLPDIQTYERLSIFGQESVEYIRRNLFTAADTLAWGKVVEREMAKVDHIMKELTGYTMNNCTDKCLTWFPAMPGEFKTGDRSLWMFLLKNIEGYVLHPIGMEFRIDSFGNLNPDTWVVNFVYFRGNKFTNFEEMLASYVIPTPDDPIDVTYSTLNHRGDPVPEKKQRGPVSFMPDGRRYSVNGHHIEWQEWQFDFNIRTIIGMQVHDLRFKQEKIAYEIGLSELGIVYSGASPSPMHSAFIDSPFGFGLESFELIPGIDCPDHATYFDFAHFLNLNPVIFKNSACVFEQNRGMPLRRHYESDFNGGFYFIQGMPGNVLILRSVITVYNYEYILDFTFHQNGALEVSIALSGYILSSYYTGTISDDRGGFQVFPNGLGQIHNHMQQFKVDLDIGQTQNRFETLDIQIDSIDDPANPAEKMYSQKFERNLRETEKNATYKFNFDTPKYLIFHNNDAENAYGNKKGYRLYPANFNKQLLPEDWAVEKGMAWARYQVAVTKQKDSERRGSSIYNLVDNIDPFVSFQDFIDDNEDIVDEDLVAWVALGTFHIPHSEDIPIVQTPGMSLTFYLLPFNYFDEDPSLASRDNIRITPNADGSKKVEYVGVSPEVDCGPGAKVTPSSSTKIVAEVVVHAVCLVLLSFY